MKQLAFGRKLWLVLGVGAVIGGLGRAAQADPERVRVPVAVSSITCLFARNSTWLWPYATDWDHFVSSSDSYQETFSDVTLPPPMFATRDSEFHPPKKIVVQ
jgi:hypothetical protein